MNTHAPIKDASQLGVPKMLILGLQHLFAMFGATILVPILVNNYFSIHLIFWIKFMGITCCHNYFYTRFNLT